MQLKFAMLETLAKRPGGRASLDELWREWEAGGQDTAERFSELEGIDILQAGLVVLEDDSLYLTDAGRSVLRALELFGKPSTEAGQAQQSHSLNSIDTLIGTELRLKIFDLGLRVPGESPHLEPLEDEIEFAETENQSDSTAGLEGETGAITSSISEQAKGEYELGRPGESEDPADILPTAPGFLKRNSASRIPSPSRSAGPTLPGALTSHFERFSRILRGHLAEGSSSIRTDIRPAGISGAVLAALSLLVILIGAGLFVGINQIRSLKSEISALEKQLGPLKKQAASADQQEKRNNAEQQKQPLIPSPPEKAKNPAEGHAMPTTLVLSPDEMRLVREYIKPAPFTGPAAPPINVGDPVTAVTIPLPSPLTDKVPKLLGARFTIRNGAIVIIKRDSRQADAVLAPN